MDTESVTLAEWRGVYTAERAAALSGVPKSTVHYWARRQILVPSVSAVRVKLWSYSDLMGLRTIYWLRQPKRASDGWDVPRTIVALADRGLDQERIHSLYPIVAPVAIVEALDLERQLRRNLRAAA